MVLSAHHPKWLNPHLGKGTSYISASIDLCQDSLDYIQPTFSESEIYSVLFKGNYLKSGEKHGILER